jgi:hypothetical protein
MHMNACAPDAHPWARAPSTHTRTHARTQINARRIKDELNVFQDLHRSPIFLAVLAITAGLQVRACGVSRLLCVPVGALACVCWCVRSWMRHGWHQANEAVTPHTLHPTLTRHNSHKSHVTRHKSHVTHHACHTRQVIIMQTPVGRFFKVHPINAAEWGISVAIGISAIPVSVLTRLLSR